MVIIVGLFLFYAAPAFILHGGLSASVLADGRSASPSVKEVCNRQPVERRSCGCLLLRCGKRCRKETE